MLIKLDGRYMIDLVCDPDKQQFYERFGVQRLTGMAFRNWAWQAGSVDNSAVH